MNYAHLIEKLQKLPAEKQAEVVDFVDYLASRFTQHTAGAYEEWDEQGYSRFSMNQAMQGLQDETPTYSESDIKERWL